MRHEQTSHLHLALFAWTSGRIEGFHPPEFMQAFSELSLFCSGGGGVEDFQLPLLYTAFSSFHAHLLP